MAFFEITNGQQGGAGGELCPQPGQQPLAKKPKAACAQIAGQDAGGIQAKGDPQEMQEHLPVPRQDCIDKARLDEKGGGGERRADHDPQHRQVQPERVSPGQFQKPPDGGQEGDFWLGGFGHQNPIISQYPELRLYFS
jgi:hypothetical protein